MCSDLVAGGTLPRCVPFQFEYVSTTGLLLSIMESMNSLCTESAAGDTPRHSLHFSFSASLRYKLVSSKIVLCSYSKRERNQDR